MRVIERFDIYMKYKCLNDNLVKKDVGFSQGLLLKSRLPGKDLQLKQIEKILTVYQDLNEVWLKTGVGSMLKSNPEQPSFHEKEAELITFSENRLHDKEDRFVQLLIDKLVQLSSENALLKEKLLSCEERIENSCEEK